MVKEVEVKRILLSLLATLLVLMLIGCGETTPTTPTATAPTPSTAFTISNLSISPTEINTGERITISILATNNGDLDGNYKVIFKIDNITVETVDVPLASGDIKQVDFAAKTDYAPGTYSVNVNGLSGTFTVKAVPPSAEFIITSFDQLGPYVTINYEVQNNGGVHLSYYKVYFTVTCDDGSQYQNWTNGSHIFIGQELPDSAIVKVEDKKVISVELDDFELTSGKMPNEVASAEFIITSFDQWGSYVTINYEVQNNGEAYISSCRAYVIITFDDDSQYQRRISGRDIFIGQRWTDSINIRISGKKVTSVELANWGSLALAGEAPAVIYEITGTAKEVDVTLNNATGGTEQYSNVSIPKKYSYSSFTDSFLYISAQNQGESGSVTVSIYVNGKLFKTSRSSGAYVIASASGSR